MAAAAGRPSKGPTLVKLVLALVATGVLASGLALPYILGGGMVGKDYAAQFLNTTCTLQETPPPQPTTIYASDHTTVIARLFRQDRKPVPLSQVPQFLQDALVATEDRRFYQHHGVDLRSLVRSALSTTNGDTQGGSTLTMQYVKQLRYYQAGTNKAKQDAAVAQTLKRKMLDARCALDIENVRHESKKQILDNYLNIAFFGENAYGIEKAAETYFGTTTAKLTLGQAAMLVGLLRAPGTTGYDPYYHPTAARERRNEVLQNMVSFGVLSQARADAEMAKPLRLATEQPPRVYEGCSNSNSTISNVGFFCDYTVTWLRNVAKISDNQLETGGLKIYTTLDANLQNTAQGNLSKYLPATSPMTAALPAIDPQTGNVLAMVSNKTYGLKPTVQTEYPIFTNAVANGASTFKLFPLLAALQAGVPTDWKLQTVGNSGAYHIKNCASRTKTGITNGDAKVDYNALETLTTAAQKSSNSYFVALVDQLFGLCDLSPVVDVMEKLGMTDLSLHNPNDFPNESYAQVIVDKQRGQQLALGYVPVSPMQLAAAYAAIANGGRYIKPAPVNQVVAPNGNLLPLHRAAPHQAIAPQVAAQAASILIGDTKADIGTATGQFRSWYSAGGSDVAGKTGTNDADTKNNSSLWFVGATPRLVAVSGLINFDQSSAPNSGLPHVARGQAYGDYAAKLWLTVFRGSLRHKHWNWPPPDSVGDPVPDVTGFSVGKARRELTRAGYKVSVLGGGGGQLTCPSDADYLTVGYYGPHYATAGSTITLCQSSGVAAYVKPVIYIPPVNTTPPTRNGNGNGHGGGNGNGSGSGSSSSSSSSGNGGGHRSGSPTGAPRSHSASSSPRTHHHG